MTDDRPGQRTSLRLSNADYDLFKIAAEAEGADSIVQWLITSGRKRARLIVHHGPVEVREIIVPPPENSPFPKGPKS